jgi:endonuclease/exonuclease/phosphatase family metal-dependent hydrolase
VIAGLLVAQPLVDSTSGLAALLHVLAPHIGLLAVLVAAGLAVSVRRVQGVLVLAAVALAVALRFGDDWVSLPGDEASGPQLAVMSWSLEVGPDAAAELADVILVQRRDIVGLEELTPASAAMVAADPRIREQYPFRILDRSVTALGLGLLSAHPIISQERRSNPPVLRASVDVAGRTVEVAVAHPLPGTIRTGPWDLPIGYDARARDRRLADLRAWLDDLAASASARVVLLGDLNVAPTEPGYDIIAAGWVDAHRAVGLGPGWTWRPSRLEFLGAGLLRIDYVLSTGLLAPTSVSTTCYAGSEHCVLDVTLRLAG